MPSGQLTTIIVDKSAARQKIGIACLFKECKNCKCFWNMCRHACLKNTIRVINGKNDEAETTGWVYVAEKKTLNHSFVLKKTTINVTCMMRINSFGDVM
jgi:hypothetical protein